MSIPDLQEGNTAHDGSASKLFRHVFGGQRGIMAIVSVERDADGEWNRRTIKNAYFDAPKNLQAAANHALAESQRGREAYFCSHLLTDKRRIRENAADVITLWAESDGGELPNGNKEPTAVVESSPGKYHIYCRLTDAIPPDTAERLNKRLARDIGADSSGFDLSQLLRVPGTVNHKYPERPEVRVVNLDGSRAYTPAELDEVLSPSPENKNGHTSRDTEGEPPVKLSEDALKAWRGEAPKLKENGDVNRSATLMKIGREEFDAGATRPAIVASLAERDQTLGYNKYTDRADPEHWYHKIVDELEASGRNPRINITRNGKGKAEPREYTQSGERYPCTDMGNAERLVARHGHRIRYCFRWKCWLIYDGVRWAPDDGGAIRRLAKDTVRSIYAEAEEAADSEDRKAIAKHAIASENETRVNSMISLARSEVEIEYSDLDTDIYALNVENGTVDLRTGELRNHDPADYISKVAGTRYDPEASAPMWERHLARILPDEAVRDFVQRACGHSFSGDVSEDALFIPYGPGGNGKTVTYEALLKAAGDYGMSAAPDLLLSKERSHPTEQADLFGARLVVSMEAEEGRKLAESLVKRLTGGDTIKARRMKEDFWQFPPTHKFHMSVNHKPEIRGTDEGIWRRVKLIPFTESIGDDEKDTKLPAKLVAELPGILAWAVRGCVEWYQNGLEEPKAVTDATREYRSEMDTLAAFLEDRCVVVEDALAPATKLYKQYEFWCDDAGEKKDAQRTFGMRLKERGFVSEKITSGPYKGLKGWRGIGMKVDDPGTDDEPDGDDDGNPTDQGPGEPPAGNSVDDRPFYKNAGFAGKALRSEDCGGRSGAKNDIDGLGKASRRDNGGNRSTSSTSSTLAVSYKLRADRPSVPDSYLVRSEDGAVGVDQIKMRGEVYALFQRPPGWLPIQVGKYVKEPGERLLRPLCNSVAYTLGYSTTDVPDDVRLQVERELEAECSVLER